VLWPAGRASDLLLVGILSLFVVLGVDGLGAGRPGRRGGRQLPVWIDNGPQIRRVLLSRMPPDRQRRVLWAWNTAIEKTGGYLYSRALLALINGGLMFLTLKLLGVPYALALGLFVGVVAAFIPIVGTYIAGAVPVLVALAAVIQAFLSTYSRRYDVLESDLTRVDGPKLPKSRAVQE
jgi:hypothetical protein